MLKFSCEKVLWLLQMKGEAEAFAIEAKAKADAEQMTKKAEAWNEYKNAAMVQMMLDSLPKVHTTCLYTRNNVKAIQKTQTNMFY